MNLHHLSDKEKATKNESVISTSQIKIPTFKRVNKNAYKCDVCNLEGLSQESLQAHEGGKKHNKKLIETQKANLNLPHLSNIEKNTKNGSAFKNVNKDTYKCDVCNLEGLSQESLQVHEGGEKHKKKLKETQLIENWSRHHLSYNNEKAKNESVISTSQVKMKKCKQVNKNRYKCDVCDLTGLSQNCLRVHELSKKHKKKLIETQHENLFRHRLSSNKEKATKNESAFYTSPTVENKTENSKNSCLFATFTNTLHGKFLSLTLKFEKIRYRHSTLKFSKMPFWYCYTFGNSNNDYLFYYFLIQLLL